MRKSKLIEHINRAGLTSTSGLKINELKNLKFKIDNYLTTFIHGNRIDNDYKNIEFIETSKKIELTDDQHAIVVADINYHYKIIACAGSGKTTTILCRIKYLIDHGIKPHQIMLTTFNVDAAYYMKKKLIELFGFKMALCIGTIDALAYRFYNMYFKRDDFIGVTEYCTEFLKFLKSNNEKAIKLKSRFKYIFFDEFQDCNNIQFEIIKELAKLTKITIIGDDAQNIYQWRGSNIDYIINFEKYISDNNSINNNFDDLNLVKTMTLKYNFRSTPEIINLANNSILINTDQIPKEMLPINRSYNRFPKIYKYINEEEQAKYTLAYIIRYINNNIKPDEIAVLSRNNYSIKYIEEEIEKYNQCCATANKINYIALITDDTRDTKPKIMTNHITLTTIHKAKGLEWDVVFILSCNDDKFPSETTPIKIQEDRRLFYVAVTRAKKYLNFSFTSKSITRFIGELDRNLYDFKDYDKSYFVYDDKRNIKFKNGVTKLIEMLEPSDVETMRNFYLIPSIVPLTYKVHSPHTYSDFIDKYYLQADFGIYIDRYISRQIGLIIPGSGGLIDSVTNIVLHTVNLDHKLHSIYLKYNYNIQKKLDKAILSCANSLNFIDNIIDFIDYVPNNPKYIRKIDMSDRQDLISLITILINKSKSINVNPSQLFIAPCNYIPIEYHDRMYKSYDNYRKNINGSFICRDIYNVSLCQNIYDGRRRLLYKDCFDEFNTDTKLYEDIDQWVKKFRNNNVLTKKCLIDEDLSICGEIDMIDLTIDNENIIDFKCSLNSDYKLEWVIQLMMYSALYKKKYGKIINKLTIYNPLKGTVTNIDLYNWDMHDELLVYMDNIRTERMKSA